MAKYGQRIGRTDPLVQLLEIGTSCSCYAAKPDHSIPVLPKDIFNSEDRALKFTIDLIRPNSKED